MLSETSDEMPDEEVMDQERVSNKDSGSEAELTDQKEAPSGGFGQLMVC